MAAPRATLPPDMYCGAGGVEGCARWASNGALLLKTMRQARQRRNRSRTVVCTSVARRKRWRMVAHQPYIADI